MDKLSYRLFISMYKLNMSGLPAHAENCMQAFAKAIVDSSEISCLSNSDKVLRGSLFFASIDNFKHGRRQGISIEKLSRKVRRYAKLLAAVSTPGECRLIETVISNLDLDMKGNL